MLKASPQSLECDCVWRQDISKESVSLSEAMRVGPIQSDWCPQGRRRLGHGDTRDGLRRETAPARALLNHFPPLISEVRPSWLSKNVVFFSLEWIDEIQYLLV